MAKFTFKKNKSVGPYASFEPEQHTIKLNRHEVGYISEIEGLKFCVSFAVKKVPSEGSPVKKVPSEGSPVKKVPSEGSPAPFKWVRLKKIFNSAEEARELIKRDAEEIQKLLDLYEFED